MITRFCTYCQKPIQARRSTRQFCSTICAQRQRRGWPTSRACRHCGGTFEVRDRSDANRQHCSKECAKNHNTKRVKGWRSDNPEAMKKYNVTRLAKNPGAWREKSRSEREEIIALLGGKCVVCGVANRHWLHVDFIETTRNLRFRHSRHIAYVRAHRNEFRVLCANHHYELTLTGRIEGTLITQ